MWDKAMEFLDQLAPLVYVVVPAIAAIWWNLKNKLSQKEKEVKKANTEKARETYNIWEHEESKAVITKIKNACNLHKDKGTADLVQYLQLENGTMATSKIQNMFLTCLAEDDRFGQIPKLITHMQRMPYSECSLWLDTLSNSISSGSVTLDTPDLSTAEYSKMRLEGADGKIGSVLIAPIFDPNEILLGICVFYYHEKNFNGQKLDAEKDLILHFKSYIENTLFNYHLSRRNKKIQLGLSDV